LEGVVGETREEMIPDPYLLRGVNEKCRMVYAAPNLQSKI
jgi:hypothetical protein